MDKTMTRFLAILAALTCAASAQTYRTVTADTNNVIRTNFTMPVAQVSGALATNGSAAGLINFPASLLRTNGDGGGLTNLPNANLTNATGVLPILNGGTGATNASGARTALELGTAATNDSTAFQSANTNLTALASGDGSSLTNVTITDASSLTNFPAELLRTNGSAGALTNFPAELLRTNGDGGGLTNISVDLTTVLPSYTGNTGKVLAVASGETNVEWTAISNTVTDASTLTNFPAIILQTNSADGSFPEFLLRPPAVQRRLPLSPLRFLPPTETQARLPTSQPLTKTPQARLATSRELSPLPTEAAGRQQRQRLLKHFCQPTAAMPIRFLR
jgi:hypothetical protein